MIYSKIADTGLSAGKIILGTDLFGTLKSKEESFELLDTFTELGGNMLDTASVYANWLKMGDSMSEKTVGEWLSERGCRDKIIISTKGGHFDLESGKPRLTVEEIKNDFEQSLINLKTDYIDIYWLHKDDLSKTPEELIEIFNSAVDISKVKCLGVSNWSYDRIKTANDYALKNGLTPIKVSQLRHSVATINYQTDGIFCMDKNEYEKYRNDSFDIFAFSSQARGFFAIMEKGGVDALPESVREELLNEHNLKVFEKLKVMASEKNTTASALALAVLINDKKVNTFAQIGPANIEQLKSSFESLEISLSAEEINKILLYKTL